MTLAERVCDHCGLPVLPGRACRDEAERTFCCAGCRAVYALLHDAGLARYYGLA
jgi:hypothetical protein